MLSRMGRPITLRFRLAGSGLFLSVPAGPLVQTMWPHRASPQGAIRIAAFLSATSQSPVGSAASAGLLRQMNAIAASQDFRILSSVMPDLCVCQSMAFKGPVGGGERTAISLANSGVPPVQDVDMIASSLHEDEMTVSLAISSAALAVWLYLIAGRGGFWRASVRDDDHSWPARGRWPDVVAIVPARDEADVIGQSLASLLAQDYPGSFAIVLVDDQSRDGTAAIAQKAASTAGAVDRTTILFGRT